MLEACFACSITLSRSANIIFLNSVCPVTNRLFDYSGDSALYCAGVNLNVLPHFGASNSIYSGGSALNKFYNCTTVSALYPAFIKILLKKNILHAAGDRDALLTIFYTIFYTTFKRQFYSLLISMMVGVGHYVSVVERVVVSRYHDFEIGESRDTIIKACANSVGLGAKVLVQHNIEIYIEPAKEQPNYYYVMFY